MLQAFLCKLKRQYSSEADLLEISGDKATAFQPEILVFDDRWRLLMKTIVTEDE